MRQLFAKGKHLATSLFTVGLVFAFTSAPVFAYHGDNGDVKTHNVGTSVSDQRDEPKVCEFYLDAFNFDNAQSVNWHITNDTHGATALSGAITLDQNGHGVTSNYKLPNGMYKLYWNFVGENGSAKHKVFKVDCDTATPCPTPVVTKPTPKPTPVPCPKPTPVTPTTPKTPTPPTTGVVLSAATTAPAASTPAMLPNTGVSTATTSLLSLLVLAITAGVVTYRPKKQNA